MHNRRAKKKLILALDESGATAIFIALIFSVICGFVGLAVDLGHIYKVRAELQRTADAGALAGAMGLVPYNNPGNTQTPNWYNGKLAAHKMINNVANCADNKQFTIADGAVEGGYWWFKPAPGDTQWRTYRSDDSKLPEPAIQVTLSKNVTLFLAPLVGFKNPMTVSATATAILPESNTTSKVVPIAVAWDVVYNTTPNGEIIIDINPSGVTVNSNNSEAGWFTMQASDNFPSSVIENPLRAGTDLDSTEIYLQPGSEVTLENQLVQEGHTYVLPVVQTVEEKKTRKIIGFAAFLVEKLVGPQLRGRFVNQYYDPNVVPTEGGAIISSVGGTPKLVIQQ